MGCLWPNNTVIAYNILPHLKESFKRFYCLYNEENLEEFYYIFHVTAVVFLAFLLCNTLKMVTGVIETRRCKK
jgi:hypothetical protein